MNISSDIRFILESALWAPSGENCQPWRFRVPTENSIEIFLDPGKDRSLYNWGQRASYVAIGAAIENALLAAGKKGYKTVVSLFPEGEQSLLVARVFFEKKENVKQDPLADAIQKRETSRKPYAIKPLSREEESALTSAAHDIPEITFSLTQKRDEVKTLGTVGSTNEVVMLANEFLHNFFFSHVNWTKQDDDRKKVGFFIDTLELPPPARIGFKI